MSRRRQDYQVAPAPPQQDSHDGAPLMPSSRRRSSLNASIAQAVERGKKAEREGAREAAIEVQCQHVFSPATGMFEPKEAVLSGTLSSEVGDQLVAVALGEEVQAELTRNETVWLGAFGLLPGLVGGVIMGLIPLNSLQHGPDIDYMVFVGLNSWWGWVVLHCAPFLLLHCNFRVCSEGGCRQHALLPRSNLHPGHLLAVSGSNGVPSYRVSSNRCP